MLLVINYELMQLKFLTVWILLIRCSKSEVKPKQGSGFLRNKIFQQFYENIFANTN